MPTEECVVPVVVNVASGLFLSKYTSGVVLVCPDESEELLVTALHKEQYQGMGSKHGFYPWVRSARGALLSTLQENPFYLYYPSHYIQTDDGEDDYMGKAQRKRLRTELQFMEPLDFSREIKEVQLHAFWHRENGGKIGVSGYAVAVYKESSPLSITETTAL